MKTLKEDNKNINFKIDDLRVGRYNQKVYYLAIGYHEDGEGCLKFLNDLESFDELIISMNKFLKSKGIDIHLTKYEIPCGDEYIMVNCDTLDASTDTAIENTALEEIFTFDNDPERIHDREYYFDELTEEINGYIEEMNDEMMEEDTKEFDLEEDNETVEFSLDTILESFKDNNIKIRIDSLRIDTYLNVENQSYHLRVCYAENGEGHVEYLDNLKSFDDLIKSMNKFLKSKGIDIHLTKYKFQVSNEYVSVKCNILDDEYRSLTRTNSLVKIFEYDHDRARMYDRNYYFNELAKTINRYIEKINEKKKGKDMKECKYTYMDHACYLKDLVKRTLDEECKNKFDLEKEIKQIHINEEKKTVTILWNDGAKTFAKVAETDEFDERVGVSLCIAKKIAGNKNKLEELIDSKKIYSNKKKNAEFKLQKEIESGKKLIDETLARLNKESENTLSEIIHSKGFSGKAQAELQKYIKEEK